MKEKLCILLAAVLLLTLCAACNTTEPVTSPSASASASPSQSASPSPSDEQPTSPETSYFPLNETATLTYLDTTSSILQSYYEGNNDLFVWQELENRTNVHIEFLAYPSDQINTQFSLLLGAGEAVDIINSICLVTGGGISNGINEEYVEELSDEIDAYMPNYKLLLDENIAFKLGGTLEEGSYGQIARFTTLDKMPTKGFVMRGDWLEDIGVNYKTLRTYDEWYDVLTAFKVEKGADAALALSSYGGVMESLLSAGYDIFTDCFVFADPYSLKEGEVIFSPLDDQFIPYLDMLRQWYADGLIWQDYMSGGISFNATTMVPQGRSAVWVGYATGMNDLIDFVEDERYHLVAVSTPRKNADDVLHISEKREYASGGVCIGKGSDNLELTCRWLDYIYGPEGHQLVNYGVEGLTYTVSNGEYAISDAIIKFEHGSSIGWSYYTFGQGTPFVEEFTRKFSTYTDYQVEAYETWNEDDSVYCITSDMSFTADEQAEYASIYNDISTLTQEFINGYITGAIATSDYEGYCLTVESMNIARCVELRQNAVERYGRKVASLMG